MTAPPPQPPTSAGPTAQAPAPAPQGGGALGPGRVYRGYMGYRDWRGELRGRFHRVMALAIGEALTNVRNVPNLIMTVLSLLAVFGFSLLWLFLIVPTVGTENFDPEDMVSYFSFLGYILVLQTAVLGSKLIADDFRTRAIVLYFCRPLHRIDYLLGKLTSLLIIMGGLTVVPALLLNGAALGVATESAATQQANLWTLGATFLLGMTVLVVFSSMGLAFSALAKKRWVAFAGLFVMLFFTWIFANIMADLTGSDYFVLISPFDNLVLTTEWAYQQPASRDIDPAIAAGVLGLLLALSWGLLQWRISSADTEVAT